MTGSCPCCGGALPLSTPVLTPSQTKLLYTIHRAGDDGITGPVLLDQMGLKYGNLHVQICKLRDRLSGHGVGIESNRKGRIGAVYRIVQGDC